MPHGELRLTAVAPSYQPAIESLAAYRGRHDATLSADQKSVVDEIGGRLLRLEDQVKQLIELNNQFLGQGPIIEVDPTTDTITTRFAGTSMKLKLNRADPNVPIQQVGSATVGAYTAGPGPAGLPGVSESTRRTYEGLLEDYYNNAHRVLKLMQELPGQKSFHCQEITIVRNKLVEHPNVGEAYSFGFGSRGPVVRPIHRPDRQWHDEGLVRNTERFIDKLVRALAG